MSDLRGPSIHVLWSELACKDAARTPYPEQWRQSRGVPLAQEFETIRRECGGKPITIGSAYRTPAYNRTLKGAASNSQHVQGRALDLYPPAGMTIEGFTFVVRMIAKRESSGIYGVGLYPTFVHVDIRPAPINGRLTVWRGSSVTTEPKG